MTPANPSITPPPWEYRFVEELGPSVWAPGRGLVACTTAQGDEAVANMRTIAVLPKVLEELRSTTSFLQAACLIMKDAESRKLAMEQVSRARAAIALAKEGDS